MPDLTNGTLVFILFSICHFFQVFCNEPRSFLYLNEGRLPFQKGNYCHASVCSSVLCLVTTKIWSKGHESPQRVTALGSWTNRVISLRQISVTAVFYLEDSRREREWERERKSARTRERESVRKRFGSSFYMFFPPPRPPPCKLGLARSSVCSAWSLHSGPRTIFWPSLSFSHRHFGLLFI